MPIRSPSWAQWSASGTTLSSVSGVKETLRCQGPRIGKNFDAVLPGDFLLLRKRDSTKGSWTGPSGAEGEAFAGLCALITSGVLRSSDYFIT
jgi:hypothetical protein